MRVQNGLIKQGLVRITLYGNKSMVRYPTTLFKQKTDCPTKKAMVPMENTDFPIREPFCFCEGKPIEGNIA